MKKILSLFLALALVCCSALSFAETVTTVTGTGTAAGYGGEITVTVELEGDRITAVEISGDDETPGIGSKILEEYPALFVENNGLVDAYSGATFAQFTRTGVLAAMALALQAAGVDPEAYNREPAEAGTAEDMTIEADIVIVGAGGAGAGDGRHRLREAERGAADQSKGQEQGKDFLHDRRLLVRLLLFGMVD